MKITNLYFMTFRSLEEVWVGVLNITGPLSNWSLANNILPGFFLLLPDLGLCSYVSCILILVKSFTAPEIVGGGPPSYICRLSGAGHENWTFWLEVKKL